MDNVISFILSVGANIVSNVVFYFIRKWLDRRS